MERKKIFESLYNNGVADILSKKFNLNDFDFEISIHIFTETIFSNMVNENLLTDLTLNEDKVCTLYDYKDNHFPYQKCCQKSFTNNTHEYTVPIEKTVDGGNITILPSYIISNEEFYPGIYLNLISPMFSTYLDNDQGKIISKVDLFKKIMIDRLSKERVKDINSKFQFSHIRQEYFSPSLTNLLDKY